jgi:prepilin-type N-terminal cleavage/methylation domain-containing protein
MKFQIRKTTRGFSLIELLLAMALGLILLASVTTLFKNGMDASRMVSQRTEMQDDVRAAVNMITKDVSLAGSGLPPGGVALPFGPGNNGPSLYGADQTGKIWVNPSTYPGNFMYGLIPGPLAGMERLGVAAIPATGQTADAITSVYADFSFPLNQYVGTFADNTGTLVNFAIPAPAPVPALPPTINGPGGIQVGDLILLSNGFGSAVGEVTNLTATSLTFAANDKLNMNQPGINVAGGGGGSIIALCTPPTNVCVGSGNITAYRLYAVTYFVEVPAAAGQLPKLMRQVDGHPAQPVADNIIGLQFTYDVCDGTITSGTTPNCAGLANLFLAGFTPNNVHKVNIAVKGQSIMSFGNHAQNMQLSASVSTRDLTFKDRYQ